SPYFAISQVTDCSWLTSTRNNAAVVINAAKPSNRSSVLRRDDGGGVAAKLPGGLGKAPADGAAGADISPSPGSSPPASGAQRWWSAPARRWSAAPAVPDSHRWGRVLGWRAPAVLLRWAWAGPVPA